eukprot:CAMPEP_0113843148 /NCGR_PEP_ID=MMETSP0328-20130328/13093_1 /TAXON_ID=39455 /ORGANISM="Alexandrium minutum" /LENGTH=176 /DNA_ID=CAMNT_0000812079 /DNA_START=10 /DNA_END=540 /DNA_ORIENTATION=+ /assembly_acc=CAM_ASM_000350
MARGSPILAVTALALGAFTLARFASDAFLTSVASRREVLGAAVAGAAAFGGLAPARADWQGEPIQIMQQLGPELLQLKDAVNGGDIDQVAAKLNTFDVYASGVLKNKAIAKERASAAVDKLSDAVSNKDAAGMKSAYGEFLKVTSLEEIFSLPKGRKYHTLSVSNLSGGRAGDGGR